MTEASERELIERAQRGDRSAFEALLRANYDAMYRMAYKWCGSKADAEDITQTACIKLGRSIGQYRFESAFLSWLYPMVINTAKDWAKARNRHADGNGIEPDRAVEPTAEGRVYASQVIEHIRALPEREREAVYLVFSEGMSHRQAAEIMSCRESTVSWYIHEARKKLQSFREGDRRHG